MERVRVSLTGQEYGALIRLCEAELRSPSEQLRHLLRMELLKRKLSPEDTGAGQRQQSEGVHNAQ